MGALLASVRESSDPGRLGGDLSVGAVVGGGVPLIAGSFLLIGAVIALVSTALSDGRKMRREDRRQWDQQVRDAYNRVRELCSQISDAVQGVASARWETEFSRRKDILDEGFLTVRAGAPRAVQHSAGL